MFKQIATAGLAGVTLLCAVIAPASARNYYYDRDGHRHYYHSASYNTHRHASRHHTERCRTTGTVLGVLGGAVLGNAITHHSTAGTVVGAGVGGVAGHQIARNNCRR